MQFKIGDLVQLDPTRTYTFQTWKKYGNKPLMVKNIRGLEIEARYIDSILIAYADLFVPWKAQTPINIEEII